MLVYLSEEDARAIAALLPTYIEQLDRRDISGKDSAPFESLLVKVEKLLG